jgi:hypothetical protein
VSTSDLLKKIFGLEAASCCVQTKPRPKPVLSIYICVMFMNKSDVFVFGKHERSQNTKKGISTIVPNFEILFKPLLQTSNLKTSPHF